MASLTKYAGTISQTTGGKYRTFSDLNNLKNNVDGSWANSNGNIKGKSSSPNRPSTITCTNFGFNLPKGAEPTKIITTYRHKKTGSLNIPAPTLTLLGTGGNTFSVKGSAPTTSMVTHQYNCTTAKITRAMVNSSNFGVKINYPANTNSSEGTLSISYVRVTVEYKMPSYSLTLKKVSGGYNEESYTVEASISNTNLTGYNPSVTLTAPTGFSFDSFDGTGEYTVVSPTVISWNPNFTSKVPSSTALFKFDVDVTYPSGQTSYTGTFTLSESLYSGTKSFSATITDRPSGSGSESEDYPYDAEINTQYESDKPYRVPVWDNDPFPDFDAEIWGDINKYLSITGPYIKIDTRQESAPKYVKTYVKGGNSMYIAGPDGSEMGFGGRDMIAWKTGERCVIYSKKIQTKNLEISIAFGDTPNGPWELIRQIFYTVDFVPTTSMVDEFDTPYFTVLEPSEEEYNRLGSGYTYIAQADIKHTTDDTTPRDWYKNNRIGIHNNEISIFFDKGVRGSKNSNWYIRSTDASSLTVTVDDEGTTVSSTDTSTSRFYFANPENSTSTYPPITMSDFVIECDVISTTFTSGSQIAFLLQGLGTNFNLSSYTAPYHIKMVKEGTTVKQYINDTEIRTTTISDRTNYYAGFQLYKTGDIKFKNYKIYAINPTKEEIFNTAEYWSKATGGLNEYNNVECEFEYDSQYPLYILMTGDYPEAETYGYDMGSIKYDTPCIIEKPVYNGRERNGTYPTPIEALLTGEDIATLELASNQTSQGAVLYSFPVDETISTNDKLAIRGLQVRANIEATDNLVIQAQLHSPNGEVGNRSILVDSQDEEIVIGGLGDLWGFTTLQMTHLELWQLELSVANILSQSDSSILFNNVEIIFYLETVEKQEITIKVDDEDIAYYGAFIETVKIPEGLNTDTSFLTIDGTDTNDAYRQNIREKKITIEFNLSNCELQTSTDMLRQLTKLFVNEKDQYNRPIPKRIQFSHYPNDYFEYIMEEPFDVDTDITDYTIKAQLTVPSGTSYSLYDTVTNTTGNANGLAAVNPIITVRPSDVNIQITESNSGQVFNIAYTGDWNDHTVEIDCEDRKVYLIKGEDERIDISKYADYNSDWFRLDGEYEFSSVNCTILSVIFNERW